MACKFHAFMYATSPPKLPGLHRFGRLLIGAALAGLVLVAQAERADRFQKLQVEADHA
mgnify:CR=1 FL=1